jgi:hypothetical protein
MSAPPLVRTTSSIMSGKSRSGAGNPGRNRGRSPRQPPPQRVEQGRRPGPAWSSREPVRAPCRPRPAFRPQRASARASAARMPTAMTRNRVKLLLTLRRYEAGALPVPTKWRSWRRGSVRNTYARDPLRACARRSARARRGAERSSIPS